MLSDELGLIDDFCLSFRSILELLLLTQLLIFVNLLL